jgi:hypothetical protein
VGTRNLKSILLFFTLFTLLTVSDSSSQDRSSIQGDKVQAGNSADCVPVAVHRHGGSGTTTTTKCKESPSSVTSSNGSDRPEVGTRRRNRPEERPLAAGRGIDPCVSADGSPIPSFTDRRGDGPRIITHCNLPDRPTTATSIGNNNYIPPAPLTTMSITIQSQLNYRYPGSLNYTQGDRKIQAKILTNNNTENRTLVKSTAASFLSGSSTTTHRVVPTKSGKQRIYPYPCSKPFTVKSASCVIQCATFQGQQVFPLITSDLGNTDYEFDPRNPDNTGKFRTVVSYSNWGQCDDRIRSKVKPLPLLEYYGYGENSDGATCIVDVSPWTQPPNVDVAVIASVECGRDDAEVN